MVAKGKSLIVRPILHIVLLLHKVIHSSATYIITRLLISVCPPARFIDLDLTEHHSFHFQTQGGGEGESEDKGIA